MLKFHDNLHRKISLRLYVFVSLSTTKWWIYLVLLGQFQNSMELLFFSKNILRSWAMVIDWSWYGWDNKSNMYLTEWIASVITMIHDASVTWTAWLILHLIANNFASVNMTLIAWWMVFAMIFGFGWIWARDVVILFLILVSDITTIILYPMRSLRRLYQVCRDEQTWYHCFFSLQCWRKSDQRYLLIRD